MKHSLGHLLRDESGQSLIEIMIGLAIGAILIGSATYGITFILRSSSTNRDLTAASNFTQGLLEKVRSFSDANWQNIYDLQKGSGSNYFLVASDTSLFAVQGKEGMIDNDVTNGLVGEWAFDEDVNSTSTTTYDVSGNGNNGILMNSPTRASSTCKLANCLDFNGVNSYVTITDPASGVLDPTSAYSISFWMQSTSTATYAFMVSKSNAGSGGGYEMFLSGGGEIRFSSCNTSGSCSGGYFDITTPLPYNDGKWHFVVGTAMTSGTADIYVDGGLVQQSGIITQNNIANSYPLVIGGRGVTGGNPFGGMLDDIRIYNRALSAAEISQVYKAGIYDRYFYIENVCRTNDASSTISGTAPCGTGSVDDPLTQEATAVAEWQANATTTQFTLSSYLTRWKNFSLNQTDWSGGSGQTGVLPTPDNTYASSTNVITTPPGSFQIQNLTQQ